MKTRTASRSRRRMAAGVLALVAAGSLVAAGPLRAGRGRPIVSQGTLVSDDGTLLRGARWSLDLPAAGEQPWTPCSAKLRLPPRAWVAEMPARGLNALHVYAEKAEELKGAGYNRCMVDDLVEWTRDAGLYLVLTIGNQPPNFNQAFVTSFWSGDPSVQWEGYAQLYAGDEHVVFEIQTSAVSPTSASAPPRRTVARRTVALQDGSLGRPTARERR